MKRFIALFALACSPAFSQSVPDGATGPAVQFTQRVTGVVIAVGSPLRQQIFTGTTCPVDDGVSKSRSYQHTPVNGGTLTGAVIGGVVGSQVGDGRGKTAAIIVGTLTGAYVGNKANEKIHEKRSDPDSRGCYSTFEDRVVGWTYTAEYANLQMQGVMSRQPNIGENVEVIITSYLYAGQ